jgi:methionine synthase II (cobalamin-independent)
MLFLWAKPRNVEEEHMNRGTTSNLGYPRLDENREWKKALEAFREAKEKLGIPGKPVMVGPYTFVKLSKGVTNEAETLSRLLPLYVQMLQELEEAGAEWVQMDEPILATSLSRDEMEQVVRIYTRIQASLPSLKIMLQTYFDAVEWYEDLLRLPVQGIGLDFVHLDGGLCEGRVREPADRGTKGDRPGVFDVYRPR